MFYRYNKPVQNAKKSYLNSSNSNLASNADIVWATGRPMQTLTLCSQNIAYRIN